MTALRAWDPDIVLLQEMAAPAGIIAGLHAHLWRTANELGMTPLLGPPGPLSVTGNHPAVLVKTSRGLTILDAGPPPWAGGGGPAPAWCQALVQVPGIPHPVAVYSVRAVALDYGGLGYSLNRSRIRAWISLALEFTTPGSTGEFQACWNEPLSEGTIHDLA
jgi:hypothetical protein